MDRLIYQIQLCFFENRGLEALPLMAQFLDSADPDDDDDRETLHDLIGWGLGGKHADAFVGFLAEKKFDFSMKWLNGDGLAARFAASGNRDPALFSRLAELGADPYLPDEHGRTVLHHLCMRERSCWDETSIPFTVELINRFDPGPWMRPDQYGATPLHYAALMGHTPVTAALIQRGADPDSRGTAPVAHHSHVIDFDSVTALQLACWMGYDETAEALLELGADPAAQDSHGRAAGHYAVRRPNELYRKAFYSSIPNAEQIWQDKCNILRSLGKIDLCDDKGNTPLLSVLSSERFDAGNAAITLIELGADVNRANNRGETPLICAAGNHSKETVKKLVAAGAEINARDRDGNTALHLALKNGDVKLARYLIGKGADFRLPNNAGHTAMDYAVENGLDTVLEKML